MAATAARPARAAGGAHRDVPHFSGQAVEAVVYAAGEDQGSADAG